MESSASLRISYAALSSTDYPLQGTNLAGDLEQLEDPARPMTPEAEDDPDAGDAALYRPVVKVVEAGDDLDAGDASPYRASLHKPIVEAAEVGDDPDAGDAALYRQHFTDLL